MGYHVTVSRYGMFALIFIPWRPPAIAEDQLQPILRRHGIRLTKPSKATDRLSFVAADGLTQADAIELAKDLRGEGLVAVARPDSGRPTRDPRISRAININIILGIATFLLIVPLLFVALNLSTLFRKGSSVVVGQLTRPDSTTLETITQLVNQLPEVLAAPLLVDAKALYKAACADPDGPANGALQRLLADIREGQLTDSPTTPPTAEQLRQRLDLARQAVQES